MSDSLRPHGLAPAWLLCPCDFPGKNTGVGCHFLLQGIFPTQELNLSLLHLLCLWHCQADYYYYYFFTTEPPGKSDSKVVERTYLDFGVF